MFRVQTDSFAPLALTCQLHATSVVAQGAIRPSGVMGAPRATKWITTG